MFVSSGEPAKLAEGGRVYVPSATGQRTNLTWVPLCFTFIFAIATVFFFVSIGMFGPPSSPLETSSETQAVEVVTGSDSAGEENK